MKRLRVTLTLDIDQSLLHRAIRAAHLSDSVGGSGLSHLGTYLWRRSPQGVHVVDIQLVKDYKDDDELAGPRAWK